METPMLRTILAAVVVFLFFCPANGSAYQLLVAGESRQASTFLQEVSSDCDTPGLSGIGDINGLALYTSTTHGLTDFATITGTTLLQALTSADVGQRVDTSGVSRGDSIYLVSLSTASKAASLKLVCPERVPLSNVDLTGLGDNDILVYDAASGLFEAGASTALNSEVIVTEASQLTGTLSSGTMYTIDGVIDMGSGTITVPAGGLTMRGLGFDISKLVSSTGNASGLFVSPVGGSGNLFLTALSIEYGDGAGPGGVARIFNLTDVDSNQAVEFNDVNFQSTDGIGTLTNYRQILMRNIGIFGVQEGLELAGPMAGGARIETTIARGFAFLGGSGCIINAGPGLTMAGRFITDANIDLPAAACFTDIAPANIIEDGGFQIIGATFLGDGTPLPNMPTTSVKARIRNTAGLRDTYVGGRAVVSSTAASSNPGANTLFQVAGTSTYSDMEWFSSATNGAYEFVYDSSETIEIDVHGHVSVTGTQGDIVTFVLRQWDDSAAGYIDISSSGPQTMDRGQGTNRAESVGFITYAVVDQNDRIELWARVDDVNNITLEIDSSLTIEER
jgi:hypothetical protein